MTAWLDEVYVGTDLDTDFQTLNELFDTDDVVDPDVTFAPFAAYNDNVDGSRSGVGFPMASLKWNGLEDVYVEILEAFWDGALSVPLYWRVPTNRYDIYNTRIYRTYLAQALYPPKDEDKQAGKTLGFEIELRQMLIQPEAT
jgi:hypothetical protein